jgi:UPF0042 nucleotide-binding protein
MLVDDDEHDGVLDGVQLERSQLSAIRSLSTMLVDTSHMTVHGLRRLVLEHFAPAGSMPPMHIRVMSFGFKHGPPRDADVTFDVRFLDNPHFEPELREKTGEEPEVREFVLGSPGCSELLDKLEDLLTFCLPRWEREGKSYLSIALGCTGGRHRSVAIAAELASRLSAETGQGVAIVHRDLARGAMMGAVSATRKVRQPEAEQAGARVGSTHGGPARGGAER